MNIRNSRIAREQTEAIINALTGEWVTVKQIAALTGGRVSWQRVSLRMPKIVFVGIADMRGTHPAYFRLRVQR